MGRRCCIHSYISVVFSSGVAKVLVFDFRGAPSTLLDLFILVRKLAVLIDVLTFLRVFFAEHVPAGLGTIISIHHGARHSSPLST